MAFSFGIDVVCSEATSTGVYIQIYICLEKCLHV